MQPEATADRRTVVAAVVLGAGGLTSLTACGSSGGGVTSSTTATSTSGTASDGGSPSASPGAGADSLVELAVVPVGGSVAAQGPSGPIVVAQPTAGSVVAFSAVCTHQGCQVQPQGARFVCPCHGSTFDAFTGKPLHGPAQAPLPAVPVKVSGQDVVAG